MDNKQNTELDRLADSGLSLNELQGENISLEEKVRILLEAKDRASFLLSQIDKGGKELWGTVKKIGEGLIKSYHNILELPLKDVFDKTGGDKERLSGVITGIKEILNIPDYWKASIEECENALKETREEMGTSQGGKDETK